MDLTAQNLENLSSIHLPSMTVTELIETERRFGARFHFSKGVWWREIRPFFYYPAVLGARLKAHEAAPRPWLALGGYYHMVPEGTFSNGLMTMHEISSPGNYKLEEQRKNTRYLIRRGLSQLRIGRIANLDDLLQDGYQVYLSWERRTKDARWKLSGPAAFRKWIVPIFEHPYKVILGAYLDGRLISYIVFRAVEGVADLDHAFTDPAYYHLGASSTLFYAAIKIAGQNPGIHRLWGGMRSMKDSLQDFKARLGFVQVPYPAYIHLRKPFELLTRWLKPVQYRRLMGQYDTEPPVESEFETHGKAS